MKIFVRLRAFVIGAVIAGMFVTAAAMADSFSKVATFAGDPDANDTLFKEPYGVVVLPGGELVVSDFKNHRIVRVSPTGAVTPFAGSDKSGSKDGPAAAAEFKEPRGIAHDRVRNVIYVADSGNDRIRKITADGTVSTLAVSGLKQPSDVAVDADGNLFVADSGNDVIRRITPAGVMTIVAGVGREDDGGADGPDEQDNVYQDGPALQATFDAPSGLALTAGGVLYIVDTKNDAVRKLEGGAVSTVAGGKRSGFADGPALTARFDRPIGIALDEAGNLLVADTRNQRIRKITLGTSAAVTTVAGTGASGLVDGPTSGARFDNPSGLAYAGAIFIADARNQVVRAIYQTVTITSVSPTSASAAGSQVRILGGGFVNGQTNVLFGASPGTDVAFVSAAEITVKIPALTPGRYDVTVTTPAGSATLQEAFTMGGGDVEGPTITAAVAPVPNGAGWNNSNVRVTFTCVDAGSGVATCSAPVDVVTEGAAQAVTGVAVDNAGNQSTIAVTVKIDKGVPVITAAVSPIPNAAGWTKATTTVAFEATDALSGVTSITPPATVATETPSQQVTGRATDVAGNIAETSVVVKLDKTAPSIASALTPVPNAAGWNKSDVTVTFNTADALSGIASSTSPVVVSTEGNAIAVSGAATDKAGNSAEASVTVKLDKTAPNATAVATPAPNAAGWNNSDLTVTFAGTDALSGVATTAPPRTIATEGSQEVSGIVTDVAGNSGTASLTVKLDKTAPSITPTLTPAPNAAGWNKSDVTVTFNAADALSGIASGTPPAVVSTEGNAIAVSGTVTDKAGNSADASVTVRLDKTLPALVLEPAPTVVYSSAVSLGGTVSDAQSGLTAVTCDGIPAIITAGSFRCSVTLPRGAHDVAVVATDAAGNAAAVTRGYTFADDTRPPNITGTVGQTITEGWVRRRPVTVSFQCTDGESGIASCSEPVTMNEDGAARTAAGTAVDKAGNSAQTTFTIGIDSAAPAISVDALPAITNAASLSLTGSAIDTLSGLSRLTCNGLPATINGTRFDCTVALFAGVNDFVLEGFDRAGNDVRSTFTISLDGTAPTVEISTPATGSSTGGATTTVTGTVFDDDHVASVTVNGVPAAISGESFTAAVPLADGSNAIRAVATDRAGNVTTASVTVTRVVVPTIAISQPADLAVTASATVDVRGTVTGAATVSVNGAAATITGDTFFAAGVPLSQGRTVITAMATSAGGRAASTSANIYRDSIPPRVVVHWPAEGATLTQSPITVTGMIDDIVVGTINAGQMTVNVNGINAQVSNRSFIATGVVLTPGSNTLAVTAIDQGQNIATTTRHVSYVTTGNRLTIVSGDAQTATIGTVLAAPLAMRLTDAGGAPLANQAVTFRIAENNGTLTAGGETGRTVTATTDGDGRAQATWTLGMRAGAGNQRVTASAAGATTQLVASGAFGPGTLLVVDSGNGQLSAVAAELPRPLVAVVVDAGSNRLAGVPVTFSVLRGGGSFGGQQSITVNTDSDGRAIARPTLGPDPGNDNNTFMATAQGIEPPATFVASGLVPGNPADTKISGVVLDNSDLPIPGVSIRIDGTSLVTQSDAQGLFTLTSVPVGYVKLFVDGSTATRPGAWPMLEYAMYTIPGADNTLGMPVYLLPIDTARGLTVSETAGGTLTLPELPGFSLTIAPGAATFPGGARTGTVSVTLVHADKMPMPPGFGQQPRFIVTIQPPGVHFDPPAAMTLPNVDGLAPGEVTEMYSFDHDLGQFVAIGTATASEDGSIVRSDPGVGIIKGGWHCGGNPASSGTSANCGYCGKCFGTTCGVNPARANQPCPSDGNPCTRDVCRGGICRHEPLNTASNVWIEAKYVNRDEPDADWSDSQPLTLGQPLYGGAFRDSARWEARLGSGVSATAYAWKAVGPTTISGPGGSAWLVDNINWQPGFYNVEVEVTLSTGCKIKRVWGQRVGVRTDDMTVVGWINEAYVLLEPSTVHWSVLLIYPPGGFDVLTPPAIRALAGSYLLGLSMGFDDRPFSPAGETLSPEDRVYILSWLFKYAPNPQPPTPEFADEDALDDFFQEGHNYKLYNRLQLKYHVNAGAITTVDTLRRSVAIGITTDPISGFLPFPGEAGPHNQDFIVTATEVHQVNDGTPDEQAVKAFDTLMQPLKWSHIGSKIRFSLGDPNAEVRQQIYPSYWLYKNKVLIDLRPQTSTPAPVFTLTPYPPGPPFPPFIYQP